MPVYRVPVTIRPPSADTEDKYLAEVPLLPGCRAWGDTIADALSYVQSVAIAFIESHRARGEPLPAGLTALDEDTESVVIQSELLVSA
jgi:predicted RNase H-like HicB family nuclease